MSFLIESVGVSDARNFWLKEEFKDQNSKKKKLQNDVVPLLILDIAKMKRLSIKSESDDARLQRDWIQILAASSGGAVCVYFRVWGENAS